MIAPFAPPASLAARPSRWSGSAWLVARGGGAGRGAGFGGGQLGGSQAGLRIAYSLKRKLAAVARLTTPLEGKGRELAIGIDWQPTRLPLRLIAEQRIVLDGGKGGPAVGLVGGIGPAAIGGGFDLEAYGQAGAIDRHSLEGFADGAARVTRRLATIGRARIDVGGGAWGGAQRGAARLDIGPSAVLALPVGRVPARLMLDWRQRIAGGARPGSGPALTLATDF
ncbi:hypothetical protein EAH87_16630 [Sphingomonas koreensis]|nr:hypothetical protein EAH87_16630 [Sphingomonas koreensis]